MPIAPERLEAIRGNAELVVRELAHARGTDFGYDKDSVGYLEAFIEGQRAQDPETAAGLVGVLGCYLGEAIIAAVPSAGWEEDEDGALAIIFANRDMAYPFNKVEKQIAEGLEDGESILSFYDVCINYVAAGKLGEAASEEAP